MTMAGRKHRNLKKIIFNIVSIIERDILPCGPPVRMGRVEIWKKVGGTMI